MIRRVSGYGNVYVLSYSVLYCCKRCKLNVLARYSHRSRKLERVEPRGLQHEPQPDRHARLGQNALFSSARSTVLVCARKALENPGGEEKSFAPGARCPIRLSSSVVPLPRSPPRAARRSGQTLAGAALEKTLTFQLSSMVNGGCLVPSHEDKFKTQPQ
jgi:hypothetical protein